MKKRIMETSLFAYCDSIKCRYFNFHEASGLKECHAEKGCIKTAREFYIWIQFNDKKIIEVE